MATCQLLSNTYVWVKEIQAGEEKEGRDERPTGKKKWRMNDTDDETLQGGAPQL